MEQVTQIVTEEVEEEESMNNIGDLMEETDNVDWIEVTNYGEEQQNTNNQIEVQMVAVSSLKYKEMHRDFTCTNLFIH